MTDTKASRECVGHVYVDHGGVAIVDPEFAAMSETDHDTFLEAEIGSRLGCGNENLEELDGHVGVFVSTGLGDGRYPVYADVIDVPGAGRRVARIVIDCLGTENDLESIDVRWATAETVDRLDLDIPTLRSVLATRPRRRRRF